MRIDLRDDELIITADRRYVAQLRALPDRRWDAAANVWRASYTRQNWDQLVKYGWPLQHLPAPTRSAFSVDLVEVAGEQGRFFAVRVPPRQEYIALCRGIPEHRAWSTAARAWLCRPTPLNSQYLRERLPELEWTDAALGKSATPHEPPPPAAPLPALTFNFKTRPFAHQLQAFERSAAATNFALLMEQRTGKTKVVIDTTAYLRSRGQVEALFVLSPNSVKDVWTEELQAHMPDWCEYEVFVDGPGRSAELKEFVETRSGKLKVLVTNVEALASREKESAYARFLATYRALVAVDEFTRFKNHMAKRTRALLRLRQFAVYRRILSGTPITQNPLDIYAPFKFLDEAILGFRTLTQARARHAIMGGFGGKQVVGYVHVDELQAKIAPHSFRVLAAECFDLPPRVYEKRTVSLSKEQRAIYDALRDDLVATLSSGQKISSAHALTRMMRLSQITGGFVVPDDALAGAPEGDDEDWERRVTHALSFKAQPIPGPNPKVDALLDLADDLPPDEKLVIWARFVPEVKLIAAKLREAYGEASTVEFYGDTSTEDRTLARARFQGVPGQDHDPSCRFFVGQEETGGIGIRLSRAKQAVYYSNVFSLEARLQSEARIVDDVPIVRGIVDLVAKGTLDARVLATLRGKKKFADLITGDAWKEWL